MSIITTNGTNVQYYLSRTSPGAGAERQEKMIEIDEKPTPTALCYTCLAAAITAGMTAAHFLIMMMEKATASETGIQKQEKSGTIRDKSNNHDVRPSDSL